MKKHKIIINKVFSCGPSLTKGCIIIALAPYSIVDFWEERV